MSVSVYPHKGGWGSNNLTICLVCQYYSETLMKSYVATTIYQHFQLPLLWAWPYFLTPCYSVLLSLAMHFKKWPILRFETVKLNQNIELLLCSSPHLLMVGKVRTGACPHPLLGQFVIDI